MLYYLVFSLVAVCFHYSAAKLPAEHGAYLVLTSLKFKNNFHSLLLSLTVAILFRSVSGLFKILITATCMLTGVSSACSGLEALSSGSLEPPSLPVLPLLLWCSWTPPLPRSIHLEGLNSLFHHGTPSDVIAREHRSCMKYQTSILVVVLSKSVDLWSIS